MRARGRRWATRKLRIRRSFKGRTKDEARSRQIRSQGRIEEWLIRMVTKLR